MFLDLVYDFCMIYKLYRLLDMDYVRWSIIGLTSPI